MVAIYCLTYNHVGFIRDCLEGFVRQRAGFRFVAVVHDDASTDGTAEVVRQYAERYPDVVIPILETENQFALGGGHIFDVMRDAVDATGARYVALCEGDDCWIDSLKLQKQVAVLEADPTLMGCVTDVAVWDQHGRVLSAKQGGVVKDDKEGRYDLRQFFGPPEHHYATPTVVYRLSHRDEVRQKYDHTFNYYIGDWTLWVVLHLYGDFYYIDQPMAAYRVNPASLTHTVDRVGRAKASVDICNLVADVLTPEYADIAARLRDTRGVWVSLMHAYKATGNYPALLGATLMAAVRCPALLWQALRRHRRRR